MPGPTLPTIGFEPVESKEGNENIRSGLEKIDSIIRLAKKVCLEQTFLANK